MTWPRRQHEHDYQPAAVQHINMSLLSAGMPSTVILRRCSCSDVESKTIVGRWTLAQVRGEREPTEAEKADLDAIVDAEARLRGH